MAMPRYSQLDLAETKWYHVVSRCVRRAYLCGHDHNSGRKILDMHFMIDGFLATRVDCVHRKGSGFVYMTVNGQLENCCCGGSLL
jgi:hypothetical protein